MKVRHIMLTTDLSKEALRPFEPVLQLARDLGARVTVLHVVHDLVVAPHGAPLAPPMSMPDLHGQIEAARTRLKEACEPLADGLELTAEVIAHQHPARGVVEWAVDNDVDLVALSTHGRTGLRRLALGSVAEEVLRRCPIPVLSFHRPE